ncbi:hypothetical protein RMATCC62417_11874 [Rhizopus microsporus]|nr:hypothetical protein RMATCC62417_11874 [Rhizopus microsporus]
MENNTQITTKCSSCYTPLPVDSHHRTCQTCRERVAASHRGHRTEEQKKVASLLDLEADQEKQLSLLMLKVESETDPSEHVPAAHTS